MNAILAFLTNPLFTKLLSLLAEKFMEWEAAQKKDNFRVAIKDAVSKGDQRAIDGGEPSDNPGVKKRQ